MLLLVISFMKVPQNLSNKAGQSEMKGFFMNSQEVVLQKGYWYSSMDASLKKIKVLGLSVLPTGLYGRF